MSKIYFAADGSFGSADDLLIVDSGVFTDAQWDILDEATDDERLSLARSLAAIAPSDGVMLECGDIERDYLVQFVGDFGILSNTAERMCCEERAEEFARAQLIDHHGIDPRKHGLNQVTFEVLNEYAI